MPLLWASILLLSAFPVFPVLAQVIPEPDTVEILAPLPGQAIQGSFPILVTISVAGFQEAVLSFRYTADLTGSWFELARSPIQLIEEELVIWDTTALTDGDYIMQLVVNREEDEPVVTTISGLRVRNYTIIETDTPAPTITARPDTGSTPAPTVPPGVMPRVNTPTLLPPNPAAVTPSSIGASLLQGVAVSLIAFAAVGVLLLIRSITRR